MAVYLAGVAGLIGALSLQPAGVATASSWISTLLTVTVAWLAGENLRSRRARRQQELDEAHRQAEQRAEEARRLIQQQAEDERRAVGAERLRIARDLHDVVAHAMSVIAVQAGAAHHVIDDRPEVARAALGSIEVTAREGLVEMRRMLGVLRSEDDATASAPTTPTEGLRDIDRLLSHFRAAGLHLQVTDSGSTADLPAALDISAYRIIQEGLTNVLRHGGPVAHLDIQRSPTQLRIDIRDDGRPPDSGPATPGTGHGLTGIRERAALFNGTVHGRTRDRRRLPAHRPAADRHPRGHAMIRVAVVDDQALVRAGFEMLLDSAPDLDVVGSAADGAAAIDLVVQTQPDVVLMDIRMPVMDGLEATRRILTDDRCTNVRVLILTTFDLDEYVYAALRAGASGFLLKDTPPADLLAGVRLVAAGEALLSPSITRHLIESFVQRPTDAEPPDASRLDRAHRPGTRRSHPGRQGTVQRRDRRPAVHQPRHRQNPRRAHPHQNRRPRPSTADRHRLRNQTHPPRRHLTRPLQSPTQRHESTRRRAHQAAPHPPLPSHSGRDCRAAPTSGSQSRSSPAASTATNGLNGSSSAAFGPLAAPAWCPIGRPMTTTPCSCGGFGPVGLGVGAVTARASEPASTATGRPRPAQRPCHRRGAVVSGWVARRAQAVSCSHPGPGGGHDGSIGSRGRHHHP